MPNQPAIVTEAAAARQPKLAAVRVLAALTAVAYLCGFPALGAIGVLALVGVAVAKVQLWLEESE